MISCYINFRYLSICLSNDVDVQLFMSVLIGVKPWGLLAGWQCSESADCCREGFGYVNPNWRDPPSTDQKYVRKRAMQVQVTLQCGQSLSVVNHWIIQVQVTLQCGQSLITGSFRTCTMNNSKQSQRKFDIVCYIDAVRDSVMIFVIFCFLIVSLSADDLI